MSENLNQSQDTTIKNPDFYILQLQFNNGTTLNIKQNDIIVFVGPNNAGKSQSLKDIYANSGGETQAKVIKGISVSKENFERLPQWLNSISKVSVNGTTKIFQGIGFHVAESVSLQEKQYKNQYHLDDSAHFHQLRDCLICKLYTINRLSASEPPNALDKPSDPPTHPIHLLVSNAKSRTIATKYFERAFGIPLVPYSGPCQKIPMYLGKIPLKDECQGSNAYEMNGIIHY